MSETQETYAAGVGVAAIQYDDTSIVLSAAVNLESDDISQKAAAFAKQVFTVSRYGEGFYEIMFDSRIMWQVENEEEAEFLVEAMQEHLAMVLTRYEQEPPR